MLCHVGLASQRQSEAARASAPCTARRPAFTQYFDGSDGYRNVKNVAGGLNAWVAGGLPT